MQNGNVNVQLFCNEERKKLQNIIEHYLVQYFNRKLGRGVDNVKIVIYEDMLLIRLEGFLTEPEKFILNTPAGKDVVRTTRMQVAKQHVIDNLTYLEEILNAKAICQTYDVDSEHDFATHLVIFNHMLTESDLIFEDTDIQLLYNEERRKLQNEIEHYLAQYFNRKLGRGVDNVKIVIYEDMLLIRLEGFLTEPEKFILNTPAGTDMVRTTRMQVAKQHVIDNLTYLEEILDAKAICQTYDVDSEHDFATHLVIFNHMLIKSDLIVAGNLKVIDEGPKDNIGNLTPREIEVLKLVAGGYKNRDIAEALYISIKTVEKHRENIKHKLNLSSTSAMIAYAIEHGLWIRQIMLS